MKLFWPAIILVIGVIIILQTAGVISGNFWGYFWGGVLIVLGLAMIMGRNSSY